MEFDKILQRADLASIRAFLKTGAEDLYEKTNLTYSEQIKTAMQNIKNILKENYPTFEEFDKVESYINEQIFILENVYFELGLLAGGKTAFQIAEKIKGM